jgi:hypothetical protein
VLDVRVSISYNIVAIYDQTLECHKKSLAIDEELQHKVEMATDYTSIDLVLDIIRDRD